MRLYDSAPSGNCYKARLLLTQLGIPFERRAVDTRQREGRGELLGDKNPALRVPVLELDDGRHLAESNAILWYLARRHGVSLRRSLRAGEDAPVDVLRAVRPRAERRRRQAPDDARPSRRLSRLGTAARARLRRAWSDGTPPRRAGVLRRRPLLDRRHRALRVHARGGRRRLRPGRLPGDQRLARAASPRSPATSRSTTEARWRPSASLSFAASSWRTRGTRRAPGRHVPRTSHARSSGCPPSSSTPSRPSTARTG